MEFSKLVAHRHSVRNYLSKNVEAEKRNAVLEAGRIAPTAANLQPVKVLVLENESSLAKLKKAANIYDAPLAFMFVQTAIMHGKDRLTVNRQQILMRQLLPTI